MAAVDEVDFEADISSAPPSSSTPVTAGANLSWLQRRVALEDDAAARGACAGCSAAGANTSAPSRFGGGKASVSASGATARSSRGASGLSLVSAATAPPPRARRRPGSAPGTADPVRMEALRAEVLSLKKELREAQEDARSLKVRLLKSEAEVGRMERERATSGGLIDLLAPTGGRAAGRIATSNDVIVNRLKAQVGELQNELRAKEAVVREMSQNTNNTKLKELDTERKTYFDEVQRLQALLDQLVTSLSREAEETAERHAAVIEAKEEEAQVMRDKLKKAAAQNVALDDELGRWLEENDALKAAILEREKKLQMAPLETNEQLKSAQKALREAQAEGRQMKRDIAKLKAEHESFLVEMKGQIKRLLAENDVEKARARSLDHRSRRFARELAEATAQLQRAGIAPAAGSAAPKSPAKGGATPAPPLERRQSSLARAEALINDAESAAASNYTPATLDPSYKRTEADNQLVAALQSEDGRKELKALFASLDLNDDGKVDSIEWGKGLSKNQALLKKYFGRGTATGARPMKELGAMFKKLDTNQDGFLSFDEMVAAARGLPPAGGAAPDEPPDEIDEEGYF